MKRGRFFCLTLHNRGKVKKNWLKEKTCNFMAVSYSSDSFLSNVNLAS